MMKKWVENPGLFSCVQFIYVLSLGNKNETKKILRNLNINLGTFFIILDPNVYKSKVTILHVCSEN